MKIILALLLLTATAPSWAVGTMIVMAYYGLQTVGMMSALQVAAAFVINYGVSTIVSRLFSKTPPRPINNGVRTQVPPASTNSIPIVYGNAYLGGTFVDAVLSQNQQVMWYVMAISQVSPNGQFTFDKTKFYYGDRLITFDATEPAKVVSLTDGAGNVDTKIADNLYIYLYRSTEAGVITNLDLGGTAPGSGLPNTIMSTVNGVPSGQEWNSSNRQMNGLAFAIVKLIYSQDDEATALQQLTFKCTQALNGTGVAKPGDVWVDYITNAKYGGDISSSLVNSTSASALNTYADQTITFTDYNGNPSTQPRYRINGVLDTGVPVLENIDKILMAADSWMAYDTPSGDWSIVINKAETTAIAFDDSNLVGDIRVSTVDINQAINQIEGRFPNKENKDIPAFVFLETPAGLLYPNEPTNKYELSFDLVNDSVQTQYLANRILEQAREDLVVTIQTTYEGIQINAGDVVSVTNTAYGWSAKLFRVMKVNEVALPDGQLGASLDLNEYNAQVYDDKPITQFTPSPNTGIPNPSYFSALSAPTVTAQLPNAAVPNFSVLCTLPATGRITKVLLFYTNVASPTPTNWKLLGFQQLTDGSVFINGSSFLFEHISLPTDTYYFAFQVANETSQSSLSPASSSYAWSPNPTSTNVAATFFPAFSPGVLQIPYASGTPTFTGIQPQLYATAGGNAVDYVAAPTDASGLFVNNSWRIGASSTTGLGDIVSTNITIGNPTDGGFYALFPQPTAMAANPATIEVPVRYKDATGTVYQSVNAICQLVWAVAGNDGVSPDKNAIVYLYQWSTSTPANPNGTSTFTWATATNSLYTGTNGWSVSVPANPGTPGIKLWAAQKSITASATTVSTSVNWGSGFSVSDITQNGAAGTNGVQSAEPTVYQWAITIPSGPTGTSTYTWSSNSFTPTPASWSLTGGTSPSPGYTLWAAKVNLVDSATVSTSSINWTTATISAVGYSGTNGSNGTNGTNGTRTAILDLYRVGTTTPTLFPSGSSTYTWATGQFTAPPTLNGWSLTPPTPSVGQYLYICRQVYADNLTTATSGVTWSASTAIISSVSGVDGSNGANGTRTAVLEVYRWAASTPTTFPSGTSTYTWATGAFTAPTTANGWSLTPGASTAGFNLYACSVSYADQLTTATSSVTWSTSTAYVVGTAGANGSPGTNGNDGSSARVCFARVASNPTPTAGNITTSGSATFPTSAQSNTTWGFSATWGATDPSPTSTNSLYQSDGIYNPSTGNTVWSTPYISSLKVGTLSAITANLGTVTAGNINGLTITGGILQTSTTGTRVEIAAASNAVRVFDSAGTVVATFGGAYGTGTLYCNGTGTSGPAVAGYSTNIPALYGNSTARYGIQAEGTSASYEAAYFYANKNGGSNHAVRGININGNGAGNNTSGLVGAANGWDFYADGTGGNYGPFTGAHDVLVPINTNINIGYIVCDVQCIARKNISNTIFEVELSNAANQIPLGIISLQNGLLANSQPSAFIETTETTKINGINTTVIIMTAQYDAIKNDYDLYGANAVGEGQVYVCGESGNITKGDLIVTSSIAGVGMKQSDNIVRNITVAKARESMTFASPTETKLIACIYLCG